MAETGSGQLELGPFGAAPGTLQSSLDGAPWDAKSTAGLPGTVPVAPETWLVVDDAYAGQMAQRASLIETVPDLVIGMLPEAADAVDELYDRLLAALAAREDFDVTEEHVTRPDGVRVPLRRDTPLVTLGNLVAEDLCVMQRPEGADEHILAAAILCFPAHWTLSEKLGRPMGRIHEPSAEFDEDVQRRVQRMFDAMRPEMMLMRMNCHPAAEPAIFTPQRESDPAPHTDPNGAYLRSERQCLRKLPRTGAIVFSIQTRMVARSALTPEQVEGYAAWRAARGLA